LYDDFGAALSLHRAARRNTQSLRAAFGHAIFERFPFGGGRIFVNFKPFIVSLCLTRPAAAAGKLVKVIPGSGGDLQISRLYSVDYQCKVDASRQFGVVQKALGLWDAGWSKGTVNENVSLYSTR
jgi:hypothetical protein